MTAGNIINEIEKDCLSLDYPKVSLSNVWQYLGAYLAITCEFLGFPSGADEVGVCF